MHSFLSSRKRNMLSHAADVSLVLELFSSDDSVNCSTTRDVDQLEGSV
jgi:hypothetical protein